MRGLVMKTGTVLSAVVLTVGLVGCGSGGGTSTSAELEVDGAEVAEAPDGSAAGWTEDDIEYKLAVVDAGGFVDTGDPVIEVYAAALDDAEGVCAEDRTMLADIAVGAVQLLDRDSPGHSEDALSMLGAIAEGAEPAEGSLACTEVAAALITLMVGD
jgi:hypothetical protein